MHRSNGDASPPPQEPHSVTALLELEVSEGDRALLREAAQLTGLETASDVLRVALLELVERRRFQSLVSGLGE